MDGLAKVFGSGIGKPFIKWVGLSVSFPSIDVNLPSFDDIFGDFSGGNLLTPQTGLPATNFSLWQGNFQKDIKININRISVPDLNISRTLSKDRAQELLALEWFVQLYRTGVVTTILIILDVLWFVYRNSRTYQLAVVLIHGFPKLYKLENIQKKEEKKEEKKNKKEKKQARKKKEKDHKLELVNDEHFENYEGTETKSMERTKQISGLKGNTKSRVKAAPTKESNMPSRKNIPTNSVESEATITKNQDIENVDASDQETKSDESKTRKVIGHGLTLLDRFNAVFLKFLIKVKELNYQVSEHFCLIYSGKIDWILYRRVKVTSDDSPSWSSSNCISGNIQKEGVSGGAKWGLD